MYKLLPKVQQLQVLLEGSTNLVFGICETWLNGRVADSEVEMLGLKVYRKDQERRSGVCACVCF